MRLIRIIGIVVFSISLGLSAHALLRMYDNGTLGERYNSARRSNITLAITSCMGVIALGAYEMRKLIQTSRVVRYGQKNATRHNDVAAVDADASSIYSSPRTLDPWHNHKRSAARSRKVKSTRDTAEKWMLALRVITATLPVGYVLAFTMLFIYGAFHDIEFWGVVSIAAGIILLSGLVALGVYTTRIWGLPLGYFLAIINLVVFPIGTVIGMLLFISLVGASPLFAKRAHPPHRRVSMSV